jgi:hypothetical protein|tara:strand:+ start:145 stop:366 length:222 start_codon:yes stop_codon:yes gene_type:complete
MGFLGSIFAPKMPKPPPIDTSLRDREAKAQENLEKEKQRLLSAGRMGMGSTILTSGRGVTDEAETGRTLLGGS